MHIPICGLHNIASVNLEERKILKREADYHLELTRKASTIKAGDSGLLALDWNNGNRNVLADQKLSGLILGQTLNTQDYEIYRALIEATAYGALKIIKLIAKEITILTCSGIIL